MTTVIPINGTAAGVAEVRRMHHIAADECLEEAINLLSFFELCGQHRDGDEFTMHGSAVADMAGVIVEKLRKAQKHHREAL
jgi:hypothetical protein